MSTTKAKPQRDVLFRLRFKRSELIQILRALDDARRAGAPRDWSPVEWALQCGAYVQLREETLKRMAEEVATRARGGR